jgi:hypothetical protein
LPPEEIRMGKPEWPDAALFLQGRAHGWIHTTRYYNCPPWPQMLVAAMERWAKADPRRFPQRQLPIPELRHRNPETGVPWLWQAGGGEAGGYQLCARYVAAREALKRKPRGTIGRA